MVGGSQVNIPSGHLERAERWGPSFQKGLCAFQGPAPVHRPARQPVGSDTRTVQATIQAETQPNPQASLLP